MTAAIPAADRLPPVASEPYRWPFDGTWSSHDTGLLMLGVQAASMQWPGAGAALSQARELLAGCRTAGLSVIFSRRGRIDASSPIARRRSDLGDAIPASNAPGWQLVVLPDATRPETVLDHGGDNAFYQTALEGQLRSCHIRNLIIAGLPTDGLVHATMRTANDMGFECLLVADASCGTTAARHDATLQITMFGNGLFGTVATTAAVSDALLSHSGREVSP